MKNIEQWHETKYHICQNRLKISRNRKYLGVSSRLIVKYIADFYTQAIPQYCSGTLADIGCGNLPMYGFYQQYVDDVVAIDWANSLHENPHLDIVADLNQTPVPGVEDDSFDSIICSDVLEHLYNPKGFLSELHRILKKDGHLLLNVPFHYWIHESPYDFHRYTPFCCQRMFKDAGFEILELYELGGPIDVLADFSSKILTCNWRRLGNLCAPFIQFLPRLTSCFSCLRKTNGKDFNLFTLGYCIVAKKLV